MARLFHPTTPLPPLNPRLPTALMCWPTPSPAQRVLTHRNNNTSFRCLCQGVTQHCNKAPQRKNLARAAVLQATDYPIIGDSVIQLMSPSKMNTGEYCQVQKMCVPGITTTDLVHWLGPLRPNAQISRLVLHILFVCFIA